MLTLREGAFPGAPSFSECGAASTAASLSVHTAWTARRRPHRSKVLQSLQAKDNHGQFGTRTGDSSSTVRGTVWDTVARCDGTLTVVRRGTVQVHDFGRRKTITVHAHHSYLALSRRHHRR
jgi:hypothetical protein